MRSITFFVLAIIRCYNDFKYICCGPIDANVSGSPGSPGSPGSLGSPTTPYSHISQKKVSSNKSNFFNNVVTSF